MAPPSVMQPSGGGVPAPQYRWGLRVGLPAALIAALFAIFASSLWSAVTPILDVTALPVVERPGARAAQASSGAVVAQAAGWIEPDPFPVAAAALTEGTVEEVLFLEGSEVRKGDVLVRLVGRDAQLELERAQAEFDAATEVWNANIEAPRDRLVAEAMVRETSASLAMARADLDMELALLTEAERVYRRRFLLRASASVSESDLTASEAELASRRTRVAAATARVEALGAELDRRRAEADAAARTGDLRTEDRLRLHHARVSLEEARLRAERMEVRAPIDGVVMRRMVEPGARLLIAGDNPAAAHVAHLYDPAKLQVRVDVPLGDAAKIGVGQAAEVVVEVLPNQPVRGVVSRITNLANIQKNTLEFKVRLENPPASLRPEMLARVRFLAGESKVATGTTLHAPSAGIVDGSALVVADYDGEFGVVRRRAVTTEGAENDGWLAVASGLSPGDLVIVNPPASLAEGTRVRVSREVSHGVH